MKIAVVCPSRGLMFSKTAEEILDNLKGITHEFYMAHQLSIPDCFEIPTREALRDPEVTHLWFVEDDMILPPTTLQNFLYYDADVVTGDYPVSKEGQGAIFADKGTVIFTGTGCLLVKREVFEQLTKPYFRVDIKLGALNYGDHIKLITSRTAKGFKAYGLHDVSFGLRLNKLGIPITDSGIRLGQRKLIALGRAGTNEGAHVIEEWYKIKPNFMINNIKKFPVMPKGELVTVDTPNGQMNTDKKFARKLIRNGLASKIKKQFIVIDDTEGLL